MFSKTSIAAFFVSGLAAIASAQVHAVGDVPNGNSIGHPELAEQVTLNKAFTITWQPSSPGPVTLWLCIGQSTNCVLQDSPIAISAPNTGSFIWTPTLAQFPKLVPTVGSGYGIQLVDESDPRIFQYSTQFGFTFPDAPATITLSSASDAPTPSPVEPVPESYVDSYVEPSAEPTVEPSVEYTTVPCSATVSSNAPFPTTWWAPTGNGPAPTIIQPTGPVGVPTSLYTSVSTPVYTPLPAPTGAAGKVTAGMGAVAAVVLAAIAL
ncbi:hypothetical protein EJ05DRAFT_502913 [Pseudovirgaria hyperparasitica]|uniref:Yeast cell wall synthesis Kre9/Knh1-like N-terminal domain-containing protein n=1 Tax=Pseudovirgaria hyperparasitica TaxID=470096 RepID=A0A6A6VYU7_9PEZI|nr:uncharacterized protein EJ05DRAFT_502913 [Pseudovirgaria hyperparasitica]KAF2755453.1 hypothetical protein EJ05DRAFT_502913 [Pseudovirgaria hyperparasitica]